MQPLRADGEIAAIPRSAVTEVPVEMKDNQDDYQHQLLRLLNTLQRENMQLRAQLRTDPLTGLFSRRALFDELEREWEHWLRYRHTASLILIDVNDFKAINDTHGHQIGDDVLIAIANQLTEQLRSCDWLARLGGDEFAILVRDSDANAAEQLALKLRESNFMFTAMDSGQLVQLDLRLAVGVATLKADITSIRQWLEAADQTMYRHKRSVYLRQANNDSNNKPTAGYSQHQRRTRAAE